MPNTHRSFLQVLRNAAFPLVMMTTEVFLLQLLYIPAVEASAAATHATGHAPLVNPDADPVLAAPAVPAEPEMVRLPGHVLPAIQKATLVAATPSEEAEPITLTVVLKREDQAGFDRYLRDLYDPQSPQFRHFLSQQRFGPTQNAYDEVLAYLEANGFKLLQGSPNRMTLTLGGTRAQAEQAFDVQIRDFETRGRRFFANDLDPAVPRVLAANILAVKGLESASNAALTWSTIPEWVNGQTIAAASIGSLIGIFAILINALIVNWDTSQIPQGEKVNPALGPYHPLLRMSEPH